MGHEELGSLLCQGMAVNMKHPGLICLGLILPFAKKKKTSYKASDRNKYLEKTDTCGTVELLGQFLRACNCWEFTSTW